MVIKIKIKKVKKLIFMFLEINAVKAFQLVCLCLSVCLGSLLTLIEEDLPECLIAPFLAAASLHGSWVGHR